MTMYGTYYICNSSHVNFNLMNSTSSKQISAIYFWDHYNVCIWVQGCTPPLDVYVNFALKFPRPDNHFGDWVGAAHLGLNFNKICYLKWSCLLCIVDMVGGIVVYNHPKVHYMSTCTVIVWYHYEQSNAYMCLHTYLVYSRPHLAISYSCCYAIIILMFHYLPSHVSVWAQHTNVSLTNDFFKKGYVRCRHYMVYSNIKCGSTNEKWLSTWECFLQTLS